MNMESRHDLVSSGPYFKGNWLERFILEFLFRIVRNENQVMPKAELKNLK